MLVSQAESPIHAQWPLKHSTHLFVYFPLPKCREVRQAYVSLETQHLAQYQAN